MKKGRNHIISKTSPKLQRRTDRAPDIVKSTRKMLGDSYVSALQLILQRNSSAKRNYRPRFPMRAQTPSTIDSLVAGKAKYYPRDKSSRDIEKKNVYIPVSDVNAEMPIYVQVTRRKCKNLSDVVISTDY